MAASVYRRAGLSGGNSAGAGGYRIDSSRELTRVLGQITSNIDLDRDMAAEAVAEYLRYRLPDLAILYPRHRFGFAWAETRSAIMVEPAVHGMARLEDVFRYLPFIVRTQNLHLRFDLARALMEHLTGVARDLKERYYRLLPLIPPLGIAQTDAARTEIILGRARAAMRDNPVPQIKAQKPWARCGEHERRQMLHDCGWL